MTVSCCCYYGGNPRFSTVLVDGTLVLGFLFFGKGALHMAPSCAWVAPVRGVGDLGESGYHFEEAEFEAHFRDQGKGAWCFEV